MKNRGNTYLITTIVVLISFSGVLANSESKELEIKIERNVPVPMRDGTILRADIHRPDHGGPYPVLVQRTPYGKGGNFDQLAKAGYIVVSQDIRGRNESDGTWESYYHSTTHEPEDGYDTVEWVAKLPGSSGKVGTFGISYPASLQWQLAPLRPPSLVAMAAWSIPARRTDMSPGTIRPAFRLSWWAYMAADMRRRENTPGVHTVWEAQRLWRQDSEKWLYWLPWLELPDDYFGYETKAAKAWLRDFHEPWNLQENCRNISVPNLDVVGWYDHANGDMLFFRTMVKEAKTEEARKCSRIIIGPWDHTGLGMRQSGPIDFGPDAAMNIYELRIRWFDYWLKGIKNGVEKEAPVKLFVMGDNKWRDEQDWPLQRTEEKTLFITSYGHANTPDGDGRLVIDRSESLHKDTYVYNPTDPVPTPFGAQRPVATDQRSLTNRWDILVYQMDVLTERFEVTGNPIVELYASSSAPDTDWFVRLIDVHPDGLTRDVCSGMVRARYRNGFDKSELIKPGEVVKYTIRMRPTSNAFLPGHRIRLDITSSDFPNYDRNHNTAANQNADSTLVTARQTIYHGSDYATRIILPWVPNPKEDWTFQVNLNEPNAQAHNEAVEADLEQVKLPGSNMAAEGASVNTKDNWDWTPLHGAAQEGNKNLVERLIASGADVNAKDRGDWTPLHYALWEGHKEVAKLLVNNGAEVDSIGFAGNTTLHWVVRNRDKERVENILATKIMAVNAKNRRGRTPLHVAINRGFTDGAGLLIANGADIEAKDNNGLTPLSMAVSMDMNDVVKLLLMRGAKVNGRDDEYEFTPLHYAARFGSTKVAEVLIAHGADIRAKDKWGYEPIHWAAYHDRPEIIKLLISKGADINARTSSGRTPLVIAEQEGQTGIVELLKGNKAKQAPESVGNPESAKSLHKAAADDNIDKIKSLLSEGVEINIRNEDGQTPLHMACQRGNKEIAELLIEEGADINAKDRWIWTPIHYACWKNHKDMAEFLISKGADFRISSQDGVTPLHTASRQGYINIATLLIAKGADVNAKDNSGQTPLHTACQRGNKEVAELLIEKGSDINVKNNNGLTSLHLAVRYEQKDIVELLIAKGADVNVRNNADRTPQVLAERRGHTEIIELLKKHGAKEIPQTEGNQNLQAEQSVRPTHPDEKYGEHAKQAFDLYLVDSNKPTPLFIWIHGGGFSGGDKRGVDRDMIGRFAQHGVSFASMNYRLTDVGPYPMQMLDAARGLQTIRHRAKQYNIDSTQIACGGGSAGAGISMWLLYHDDLGDKTSDDPIARQSTRITCALSVNGQTTYDPRVIQKLFDTNQVSGAFIPFYRMKNDKDLNRPELIELFEDASIINHATADDPPLYLFYRQANRPLPINSTGQQHIHHPKFGPFLKSKTDKLGLEVVLMMREDYESENLNKIVQDQVDWVLKNFGIEPKKID